LETLDFRENKPEPFKEFIFYIDNAKITVLSDKGTERTGDGVTNSEYAHFHFHLFYELFYVNEGKFTIKFENGEKEFEKDDLIIVAPGTNHRTIMIDPGTSRYNINFLMEKTSIKTEFSLYDALTKSLVEPFVCLKNCSALREVLKKLVLDIMQCDSITLGMHFHELAVNLLEKTGYHKPRTLMNNTISDSNMIRMYKLQQIIATSHCNDISLNYVAEKLFLSERQASRIIKQYYGCTYRELVARTRMKTAANLLENTNMTILEIASQTGYSSIKGFYTYFKKQYNCLPTEYRKRVRKKEKQIIQEDDLL